MQLTSSPTLNRITGLALQPRLRWLWDSQLWLELFAASNLAVLAIDIYIAHSVNRFRNPAEYIPLYFSIAAPVALFAVILLKWGKGRHASWKLVGLVVGWLSLLTGLAGVVFHLESRFFLDNTLKSLTYAAPFAAPLAYSGLGFLLLMNRMVAPRSSDWSKWVVFLALGGFFGNFILSLTDHASNGFFSRTEWIPVGSSALATGFLVTLLLQRVTRRYLDLCVVVMLLQAFVGVLGFWYHLQANLEAPGASFFDKIVNGAPPFAPLLFPNLVWLAFIGLWTLVPYIPEAKSPSWFSVLVEWLNPNEVPITEI